METYEPSTSLVSMVCKNNKILPCKEVVEMNLSTFLILLVVVAVVGLIIWGMVKDKRAGKSSCGGDCSHCGGVCHMPKKPQK